MGGIFRCENVARSARVVKKLTNFHAAREIVVRIIGPVVGESAVERELTCLYTLQHGYGGEHFVHRA